MLEKAIATTRRGKYTHVQYARFADDMVILIDSHPRNDWLMRAVDKRLREVSNCPKLLRSQRPRWER
jgi:RNA-directed DNA polymerase